MKIKNVLILLTALLFAVGSLFAQTVPQPVWRVDDWGNITVDGQVFRISGAAWTGLQGRQIPADDPSPTNPAPMEMYIGNPFWVESGRTYAKNISEFKQMGFNLISIPVSPQTLDPNDPSGRNPFLYNAPSVRIENSRLALEQVIKRLNAAGMYVLLDLYSCSNYVGWRAGRLDARPPYPDSGWDGYDYFREDCSCSATNNPSSVYKVQAYDMDKWLETLKDLAGLAKELGVSNIMGINIFNEPWDYTWDQWRSMIDLAYEAINEVNPNILIFAQGVSFEAGRQDGSPQTITTVPHGAMETKPYPGENLYEAGGYPPNVPKSRIVFAPHVFGPSKYIQPMFMDPLQPECEGLEGDAAGDAKCNIVIDPQYLAAGWDEHFGYLKDLGYAVVIGSFGGNLDWPRNALLRDQNRYSYLSDHTVDLQWQLSLVDYLLSRGILDTIYWAINPEDINTGGIYKHAYDPVSNISGWDTWLSPDQRKISMLRDLFWRPDGASSKRGYVNSDSQVDIVDALLVAQHSVGLTPPDFDAWMGDADCNGNVNIVDALKIAQYYVGLLHYSGSCFP